MADVDLFAPLSSIQWVERERLKPNDYNPNKVNRENLKLLVQSIMTNGWTLPIVVRPDYTIIDGFHRWTVAGEEPLHSMLGGKVPVVIVRHDDATEDIYGTVTHNRARGTHLLEPMKAIVKRLLDEGKSVQEIGKILQSSGGTQEDRQLSEKSCCCCDSAPTKVESSCCGEGTGTETRRTCCRTACR